MMAADPEAALAGEFGRVAADGVGIDPAVSAHDRAQGQHIGLGLAEGRIDHAEGVKEHVDALVVIFITAGHEEDAGILGQSAAQQTAGGLQQPLRVSTSGVRPRKTPASSAVMRLTVVKQSASRAEAVSMEHLAVML